ncbi:MAG TPA: FeoA family protein [Thermoanaerobaculia bacterium]
MIYGIPEGAVRLADLPAGSRGLVALIAPCNTARLARLASLGIITGTEIVLLQKRPSPVIRVGATTLAIGEEIAKEIYVRQ